MISIFVGCFLFPSDVNACGPRKSSGEAGTLVSGDRGEDLGETGCLAEEIISTSFQEKELEDVVS